MKALYTELGDGKVVDGVSLNNQLFKLLQPGFTEVNGAVLLKTQKKLAGNVKPDNFPDLTGYECFVNHMHIEDYLGEAEVSSTTLLAQGLVFARKLFEQFCSTFPDQRFRVIVAFNDSGCSVRFHLTRKGEDWLANDLEEYGQEAILVLI